MRMQRMGHFARIALLLCGAGGFLSAAAGADFDPTTSSLSLKSRGEALPRQQFRPMPGRVVGVLIAGGQDLLANEGRTGPADAYCFSVGGESYRWMFVPVNEKPLIGGMRLPVGKDGKTIQRFDKLSFATPATLKSSGITGQIALVEVTVNDGLGSPAGERFVGSKLRRLDGTPQYPMPLLDVVTQLHSQYRIWLKGQFSEVDLALAEAEKKSLQGVKATGPREQTDLLYVSWLPETQRLQVRFQTRWTDGAYRYAQKPKAQVPEWLATLRAGFDSDTKRRLELREHVRYGTSFGVEAGVSYEVSVRGELASTKIVPISSFQRTQKPPAFLSEKPSRQGIYD